MQQGDEIELLKRYSVQNSMEKEGSWTKNRRSKKKTNETIDLKLTIPLVILNIIGPHISVKKRSSHWIKQKDPTQFCL